MWPQEEPIRKGGRKRGFIARKPGGASGGTERSGGRSRGEGSQGSPLTPSGYRTGAGYGSRLITPHVQLPWALQTEKVLGQTVPKAGTSFT